MNCFWGCKPFKIKLFCKDSLPVARALSWLVYAPFILLADLNPGTAPPFGKTMPVRTGYARAYELSLFSTPSDFF